MVPSVDAKGKTSEKVICEAGNHVTSEIAAQIKDLPREERLRAWQEKTGKSEAALYRRLAELDGFSGSEK